MLLLLRKILFSRSRKFVIIRKILKVSLYSLFLLISARVDRDKKNKDLITNKEKNLKPRFEPDLKEGILSGPSAPFESKGKFDKSSNNSKLKNNTSSSLKKNKKSGNRLEDKVQEEPKKQESKSKSRRVK